MQVFSSFAIKVNNVYMIEPNIPLDEELRIAELYKYELLDTVYEKEFDEIVQLASKICNVPITLITLIDRNRQWFKAKVGLDVAETSRSVSFCGHAILHEGIFEIQDAIKDERFSDNPLVIGYPNIRFYAGMPIVSPAGYKLGTLCVIDTKARHLSKEESFALSVLSKMIIKLFELRISNRELKKSIENQQKIITIMAHDIRGPLNTIKATFELKNDGFISSEEAKEIDGLIEVQIGNTVNLLNNIVDWGKLILNYSTELQTDFNLHDVCEKSFDYYLIVSKAKNNQFKNSIKPDLLVYGNSLGYEFIIRNLIANANKFTSNGSITVSAFIENDFLFMTITDTGVGMSDTIKDALNNKKWSSYTVGTQNEKGSGMGLKLVSEYIATINGTLHFESKPNEGTIVTIKIPQH